MWSKVSQYIEKHKLLNDKDLYLVALSGGADSVALLLLLHEHGYRVAAAHCNFHLRGDESDRDERFCAALCDRLGVTLHRAHFDTRTYAELHKVSIEMAARELRYRWFGQLCEDVGAAGVCVAHHRDDSVETVLLNLTRGTGLRGLCGIKPKTMQGTGALVRREWAVLRPLLCVSRAEIEAFLAEIGQNYVTDSTNLEADVQRNKLRLQVLPLLQTLNPDVAEAIQRTAENLTEAQAVLDALVGKYKDSNVLDLSELSGLGSSEYITFEWLKNYGFNGSQVRQILSSDTGGIVTSPIGYDVLKDRSRLVLGLSARPVRTIRVPEEGTYVAEDMRFTVRKSAVYVSKDPRVATVDASKVQFPLTVRNVQEGDRMHPYGMKGTKLLSDLMTDLKMNVFEKRRQLVVVDSQGVVVWLVGVRVDARVAVGDGCREVLVLQCG